MSDLISRDNVIRVIDEVMNNREIDSIRNAILAIRDKVIDVSAEEPGEPISEWYAKLSLRGENVCLPKSGTDDSVRDGAYYVVIDTSEKVDTGLYGTIYYTDINGHPYYGKDERRKP